VPELGRSKPVSTFTSVDLPAPFGPIRPTTSRGWSSSVTSCSAWTPANERETAEARRVSSGLLSIPLAGAGSPNYSFGMTFARTRPLKLALLFWIWITR